MTNTDLEKSLSEYEKESLPFNIELIRLAEVKQGDLVLDVGCGSCPLLNLKTDYEIIGLDYDRDLLKIAKHKNNFSKLIQGDAKHLPFINNSFDAVIAVSLPLDAFGNMLMYLDAVREMIRVLKPGRKIAIIEDIKVITGRIGEVESLLNRSGFSNINIPQDMYGTVCGTKPEKLNEVPRCYSWEIEEMLYPQ